MNCPKPTNVKITYETVCPLKDLPIQRETTFDFLSYHVLTAIYDDIDNGQEVSERFLCPHCNQYHEVTLYRDDVGGFCS